MVPRANWLRWTEPTAPPVGGAGVGRRGDGGSDRHEPMTDRQLFRDALDSAVLAVGETFSSTDGTHGPGHKRLPSRLVGLDEAHRSANLELATPPD
jgi:hypothetical protein